MACDETAVKTARARARAKMHYMHSVGRNFVRSYAVRIPICFLSLKRAFHHFNYYALVGGAGGVRDRTSGKGNEGRVGGWFALIFMSR